MPRSIHIHKSMLLKGVKFPPATLDRSDIEAVKGKAGRSGRSYGGAPLRSDNGNGRGRGQFNYADPRPNPFAAHLPPGFSSANAPGNYRGPPPPPTGSGWIPPPSGSDPFMRGPPPPPTAGYPYGYQPQPQGYQYTAPSQSHNAYQNGGQYNGGYMDNGQRADTYRGPPQPGDYSYNAGGAQYRRY